jgi:hypothetical protein
MRAPNPPSNRTFEDITVSFIGRHVGKIYLGLLVLSTAVVMWR